MNKIELMGRIVKDIEIQKSKAGKEYIKNTIAVRKDDNNTLFIDFMVFGKSAEAMCKYAEKGNRIIIEGTLDVQEYEDKNKNKRTSITVLVNDFYFVDFKKIEEK